MSAFLSVNGKDCTPDPSLLASLSRAIATFGEQPVSVKASVDCQMIVASSRLEKQPALATEDNGPTVAGNIHWTARYELMHDLQASPGSTDAELLLSAYRRWGTDLLLHVQGNFAFVLFDPALNLLLAATDHFGTRPVFYASGPAGLLVSDSTPVLRDSGVCDISLNENSIGDYLSLGFIVDESETFYRGIKRLPPAGRLVSRDGHVEVSTYWQPPPQEELLLASSMEEYAEQLRALLLQSVSERIPASGALGVMLSGGMDSTSVAACLCKALGRAEASDRVIGFTYVSRLVREQEGHYASSTASHLGIGHRVFTLEDSIEESRHSSLMVHPPDPSLQPPSLATSLPGLEMAGSGGTLFSGHGGDDLFRPSRRDLQRLAAPGWLGMPLRLLEYWVKRRELPSIGLRASIARKLGVRGENLLPLWTLSDFAQRTVLEERLDRHLVQSAAHSRKLRGPFWTNILGLGVSSQTAAPFDVTYPFFDLRLLRFVSRLPDGVLLHKRILREAMRPLLPSDVLQRPKTLFGAPSVQVQIDPGQQQRRLALLDQNGSTVADIVNLDVIRRSIMAPESDTSSGLQRIELLLRWIQPIA